MNGLLTSAPVLRKKPQGRLRCQPRPVPEWFQFTVVLLCILQLGFEPKGPVLTKSYDDATGQRGHLLSETFAPASGTSSTLTYQFDGSTSGGLGQLTSAALTGAQTGGNTSTYGTYARLSQQNLSGTLLPATGSPVNDTNYDATGELTSHNPGSNADTLTWDACGRLVAMQRNPTGNGFSWSAVYDGLGRRLQTSYQTISGGNDSGTALVTQSSYDPDVQFLVRPNN